MKITNLDHAFILFDTSDPVPQIMWMESPVTPEHIRRADEIRGQMLDALSKCNDGEAAQWIAKIERLPVLKESPGKPFTVRNAILASLFADSFPMRDDDYKESPDDKAAVAALVIKVYEADGELNLDQKEVDLIKRYTYECDQAMPVVAQLYKALDGN